MAVGKVYKIKSRVLFWYLSWITGKDIILWFLDNSRFYSHYVGINLIIKPRFSARIFYWSDNGIGSGAELVQERVGLQICVTVFQILSLWSSHEVLGLVKTFKVGLVRAKWTSMCTETAVQKDSSQKSLFWTEFFWPKMHILEMSRTCKWCPHLSFGVSEQNNLFLE